MNHSPTLLEAFDNVQEPVRPVEKPLHLPPQDVYKVSGIGTVPLVVLRRFLKPGMMTRLARCGVESECRSVETHDEALSEAKAGDSVWFNVRNVTVKDIWRGYVASVVKNKPTTGCENFTAQINIMAHTDHIRKGYTPVLTATLAHACKVESYCGSSTSGWARGSRLSPSSSRTATLLLSSSSRRSRCGLRCSGVPASWPFRCR